MKAVLFIAKTNLKIFDVRQDDAEDEPENRKRNSSQNDVWNGQPRTMTAQFSKIHLGEKY
jgi:hypothetical protein